MKLYFVFFYAVLFSPSLLAQKVHLKLAHLDDIQFFKESFRDVPYIINEDTKTYVQTGLSIMRDSYTYTTKSGFEISLFEYLPQSNSFKKVVSYLTVDQINELKKKKKIICPYHGWVYQGYWYLIIAEIDTKEKKEEIKLLKIMINNPSDISVTELGVSYSDYSLSMFMDHSLQIAQKTSEEGNLLFVKKGRNVETRNMEIFFWNISQTGLLVGNASYHAENAIYRTCEILSADMNDKGDAILLYRQKKNNYLIDVPSQIYMLTSSLSQINSSCTNYLISAPEGKPFVEGAAMISSQGQVLVVGTYSNNITFAYSAGYCYATFSYDNIPKDPGFIIVPWPEEVILNSVNKKTLSHGSWVQPIKLTDGTFALMLTLRLDMYNEKGNWSRRINAGYLFLHFSDGGLPLSSIHLPFDGIGSMLDDYYPYIEQSNNKLYMIFTESSDNIVSTSTDHSTKPKSGMALSAAEFDPTDYSWTRLPVMVDNQDIKGLHNIRYSFIYPVKPSITLMNTNSPYYLYSVTIE